MAKTERFVDLRHPNNDILVTGTKNNKQSISFADLKDEDGNALSTTFTNVPFVDVVGKYQQRDAYTDYGDVSTTTFKIYLEESGLAGITSGYFILRIVGD